MLAEYKTPRDGMTYLSVPELTEGTSDAASNVNVEAALVRLTLLDGSGRGTKAEGSEGDKGLHS